MSFAIYPLRSKIDQHQFSPQQYHYTINRKAIRIIEMVNKGKVFFIFLILSNSLN